MGIYLPTSSFQLVSGSFADFMARAPVGSVYHPEGHGWVVPPPTEAESARHLLPVPESTNYLLVSPQGHVWRERPSRPMRPAGLFAAASGPSGGDDPPVVKAVLDLIGPPRSIAESLLLMGVRQALLRMPPEVLNEASIFLRFPERLAIMAVANAAAAVGLLPISREEVPLFNYFLSYKLLVDDSPAKKALLDWTFLPYLRTLHDEFVRLRSYFSLLYEMGGRLLEYLRQTEMELYGDLGGIDDGWKALRQNLLYYVAERVRNPGETWQTSVAKAVERMMAEGQHHPTLSMDAAEAKSALTIWYTAMIDYAARNLANHPSAIAEHRDLIARDFPEAIPYSEHREVAVSWEEVEDLRRHHLPEKAAGQRPLLMIVGIGTEWDTVVRYAERGYDLVLVDPSNKVEAFFREKEEVRRELETRCGVKIAFRRRIVQNVRLVAEFGGQVDSVEIHNIPTNSRIRDWMAIDEVLKTGGVLVDFHPSPIDRSDLISRGYQNLGAWQNIPAVLNTTCERLAYPLGNHLLILKKPS